MESRLEACFAECGHKYMSTKIQKFRVNEQTAKQANENGYANLINKLYLRRFL